MAPATPYRICPITQNHALRSGSLAEQRFTVLGARLSPNVIDVDADVETLPVAHALSRSALDMNASAARAFTEGGARRECSRPASPGETRAWPHRTRRRGPARSSRSPCSARRLAAP